jgi:hypothetical protein
VTAARFDSRGTGFARVQGAWWSKSAVWLRELHPCFASHDSFKTDESAIFRAGTCLMA